MIHPYAISLLVCVFFLFVCLFRLGIVMQRQLHELQRNISQCQWRDGLPPPFRFFLFVTLLSAFLLFGRPHRVFSAIDAWSYFNGVHEPVFAA